MKVKVNVNSFLNGFSFVKKSASDDLTLGQRYQFRVMGSVFNLEDNWDEIKELFCSEGLFEGDFESVCSLLRSASFEVNFENRDSDDKFNPIELVMPPPCEDGSELTYVFKFTNPRDRDDYFYVKFDGWYSSWDDSRIEKAYLAEPFLFSETRYRKKSN